ncbi:fibrillin-3-like [Branchiostoma floridae]|uniref:Fibrillin-3-like n=1 Tax=Branchiostoma floridae TaxID=7739 RepID=A0A9J7LZR4_BRAFL|nr:fibrillin-3-like [Branchiostoma floridae]
MLTIQNRATEAATCGGRECTGDNSETSSCNRHCPHGSPNGPGCNCAGTGYDGTCCDNDIDECATGVHSCHQHATCTNTVGSYRCTCNSGYTGDGRTCTALCWGSTTCPRGGICSSPNHCTSCNTGYESPDCGNIDECATDTDNCHEDASCTDTDGSFTCTCNDGYTGSGLHCAPECIVPTPPLHGAVTCGVAEGFQKYCSLSCQDSHDFAIEPADSYRCDLHAIWHPAEHLPWPDCSGKFGVQPTSGLNCRRRPCRVAFGSLSGSYRTGRARQKNELYYYNDSCAFNEEDIKRDLLRLYATLGNCSAGIRCGISDIDVTCGLNSRKRRDTSRDTELREHSVEFVVKRSALGNTIKLEFVTEAESLAEEPTATDQSGVIGALDNMYFEIRARVAARTFNLEVGGESLEAKNYVGFLPTFDIHCEEGQIERIETFGAVCINCPVRTYHQDNTCLPCPPGWYQDEEAQTECKICPSSGNLPEGCEEEPDHCYFNPCLNGGTCNDFVGFYNCTCPDSFTGSNCEEDVDECAEGIDLCHEAATCTNTHGGYNCTCGDRYTGDGYTCIGIDECQDGTHTCDEHATCANTAVGYTCGCNQGYDGDGFTCADINECDEETDTCHEDATCSNTPGSYTCVCNQGYLGDGNICTDVNECEEGTDTCDEQATCTNTPGGYTCECNDGYSGNGFTCTDIHECDDGTHTCDEHATCSNTPGGHTCVCNQGYDGDGFTCTEINECDKETDTCHADATCSNTPGSYTCVCNQGYDGDGNTCTDDDECALQTDTCDEHATCNNTPGDYTCACLEGFSGDGYTCTDDDECAQESTCDEHATCTNTPGSYSCACNEGYTGNGNTCTERCSSNFEFCNDACYYLSPNRKTFLSAESDCDRREAKLAVVPDLATHQCLIRIAKNKRYIWIGLSDRGPEGEFVWSNGAPLGSFHPWIGLNYPRTDCVAMIRRRGAYRWRVNRCKKRYNYFCQQTAATNP